MPSSLVWELAVLALAVLLFIVAVRVVVRLAPFILNAIVGLIVLFAAEALGVGVAITWVTLVICAIAGLPGALLVVALAYLEVAFVGAVLVSLP